MDFTFGFDWYEKIPFKNSDNITLSIFRGTEEIQPTDENYYYNLQTKAKKKRIVQSVS
jgi:hypothetical protein